MLIGPRYVVEWLANSECSVNEGCLLIPLMVELCIELSRLYDVHSCIVRFCVYFTREHTLLSNAKASFADAA